MGLRQARLVSLFHCRHERRIALIESRKVLAFKVDPDEGPAIVAVGFAGS